MSDSMRWPWAIITIHWLTALVVAGLFAVGLWMVDLNYYSEWYKTAPYWHKSVGLILATVTAVRLLVRITTSAPEALGKVRENRFASLVHGALYLLLILLFISGYLISTADGRGIEVAGLFIVPSAGELFDQQEDVAGDVHAFFAWSLVIMVGGHAAAALKHHFVSKDRTLVRMLGIR